MFIKDPKGNILGFVGHMVLITAIQLCHYSMIAVIDSW